MTITPIRRALLSVSDKTGLVEFARFLHAQGAEILSTGGTAKALREAGITVTEVSDYTDFPEIMDGRVKTLHPRVHGGLLGKRDDATHLKAMETHGIQPIDLVAITLYPFEATVARGASYDECIENIDIGGPGMIRSAAKNHAFVTVITDPQDYARVREAIETQGGTELALRAELARKAYMRTGAYDAAISAWFAREQAVQFPETLTLAAARASLLHYGENPHQKAAFYASSASGHSLAGAQLAQGNALSYNNLNDASAAFELASEFSEATVAIIKHANPCGVATGENLLAAYGRALACDPVSAYGGIIAVNRPLDKAFAEALGSLFVEVLIAPAANADALEVLKAKKKLRLLLTGGMADARAPRMMIKSISGGYLYQEEDTQTLEESALRVVTKAQASPARLADMRFAFTVAKHVKSNAIVLAKDGATLGIGAGQMSRIDSTRIACRKAADAGLDVRDAVLASDAFFPFSDNVELAAEAGIAAIIQPGGSIRDAEVVEAADRHGMAMAFTGLRHFRH